MYRSGKFKRERGFFSTTYVYLDVKGEFNLTYSPKREDYVAHEVSKISDRCNLVERLKDLVNNPNLLTDQLILQEVREYLESEREFVPKFSGIKKGDSIQILDDRFNTDEYRLYSDIVVSDVDPYSHITIEYAIKFSENDKYRPSDVKYITDRIYHLNKFKVIQFV